MDDLLKDAIADAKAVRETALANAKIALEEAFTPRIQSMLSQKIQSETEGEEEAPAEEQVEEPEQPGIPEQEGEEEEPEIAGLFKVMSVPNTTTISKSGGAYSMAGALNEETLKYFLEGLISKK